MNIYDAFKQSLKHFNMTSNRCNLLMLTKYLREKLQLILLTHHCMTISNQNYRQIESWLFSFLLATEILNTEEITKKL